MPLHDPVILGHIVDETTEEANLSVKPGDRLVIKGHRVGEAERDAEILEIKGEGETTRYLVKWADGHEGWVYPGSDAVVEPAKKKAKKK